MLHLPPQTSPSLLPSALNVHCSCNLATRASVPPLSPPHSWPYHPQWVPAFLSKARTSAGPSFLKKPDWGRMLIYPECVCAHAHARVHCSSEWPVISVVELPQQAARPLLPTRGCWFFAQCCVLWQPHTIFRNLTTFLLSRDPTDTLTLGKHNT